jgi:glycosyltransferase involved in cell wall biosynthesis
MCTAFRRLLESKGVRAGKTAVLVGGADPNVFAGHERGSGLVGLCSAFYPRKSPDLISEVVRALPHRSFLLLGRHWHQYSRMPELLALPNFRYVEAPYDDYPKYYGAMDVFLSAATVEGGPIPLLEAMMSNAVPVAAATGFAPDLIDDQKNGFLFPPGAPAATVAALVDSAYALRVHVRRSVEQFTWDRFASQARELLVGCP